MRRRAFLLVTLSCLSSAAFPSTWVDVEVTCPVCGTVNVFKVPASFGTYVYQDPSRFQYVFWPATTDTFLYTCRRCHLTAYMQDFAEIPPEKITALAAMLEQKATIEGAVIPYYEIPIPTRLRIAREVYELLGRDDAFWCEFHRIAGYHLAEAGDAKSAHEARARALSLAETLYENEPPSEHKETLVIIATMRFLTGDVPGARRAMEAARATTFGGADRDAKALNQFLTELLTDFDREMFK